MANTNNTAKTASDILAKATNKIHDLDPKLANELTKAVAEVMARYQGR